MTEFGTGGSAAVALYVKRGTATITAGNTEVTITHNLGYSPVGGSATALNDSTGVDGFVDNLTSTTAKIKIDFAQPTDADFMWVLS